MSASLDAVHWRRKNSAGSEHGGNDYCKVVGEAYQERRRPYGSDEPVPLSRRLWAGSIHRGRVSDPIMLL